MKIEFNHWNIDVDVEATRAAYAAISKGDSESCSCSMCRNFLAQRNSAYPSEVLILFKKLGIDAQKELVNSSFATAPGKHLYLVGHCFVGTALPDALREAHEMPSKRIQQIIDELREVTDPLKRQSLLHEGGNLLKVNPSIPEIPPSAVTFISRNLTPVSFPSPTVTTDTSITLPWVIKDPEVL